MSPEARALAFFKNFDLSWVDDPVRREAAKVHARAILEANVKALAREFRAVQAEAMRRASDGHAPARTAGSAEEH